MKLALGILTAVAGALSVAYYNSTSETYSSKMPGHTEGKNTAPTTQAEDVGQDQNAIASYSNSAKLQPSPRSVTTPPWVQD
jgi:hypothetical protein